MNTPTNEVIRDLLTAAAVAHGAYEADELDGVYDEEWPTWYAEHMANALAARGYRLVGDPAPATTSAPASPADLREER